MAAAKADTARQVVAEYFDALAAHDLDRAVATWQPGSPDRLHGFAEMTAPDGIRDYFAAMIAAVPDLRLEVLSMVAENDDVAVRWRMSGTFGGEAKFEGLAPNGRRLELEGLDLLSVKDGRIVSNHAYTNGMEFARQVGALPPQGSAAERAMSAAFNAKTALAKRLRGG